jgi:hypothetical protein
VGVPVGSNGLGSTFQNVPARVAAGAFGFLIFSHAFDGPDLYGALSFFETRQSRSQDVRSSAGLWLTDLM